MGTDETQDDVLILADPYDTTDHNQDGYYLEAFERLVYGWGAAFDSRRSDVFFIPYLVDALPFKDVGKGAWYYNNVYYMWENGLMKGTSNTQFSPNTPLTRGMAATVLYRMEGEPDVAGLVNPFSDVANGLYYTDAIIWAADKGIVLGYGNGKFGPNDNVTREQLAAILMRYCVWKGIDVSVGEDTNILSYNDAFDISEWAIPAFQWACGSGIVNGKPGGLLDPKGNATRAEIATILHSFLKSVNS
jgi:hypothetical protein